LPPKYSGIELSPLMPFATNKVLANISQKRILSTTRNSEVVSDPSTALALYCAKRRAKKIKMDPKDSELVAMATSQRVIRQNKLKKEVQNHHFRTFTIGVAGRDTGFEKFEKDNLKEHLIFFLSLLKNLNQGGEYSIREISVIISNVGQKKELLDIIKDSVVAELIELFPEVTFKFDLERRSNYYNSLCYHITAKNKSSDEPFTVVGGGMSDWTAMLVGSKKEKFLFGSIGSEILGKYFKN
jgi:histidyl-tRNA synthetase